jgi:cell division protein FtsQ
MSPTSINPDLILIKMQDGNEVKISLENLGLHLNNYRKIASQMKEAGVIDMEVGVFSYPFSKKEEEEKRGKDSDAKPQAEEDGTYDDSHNNQ